MMHRAIIFLLGLSVANFGWQAFGAAVPDYALALDRSYFQAVALLIFAAWRGWVE